MDGSADGSTVRGEEVSATFHVRCRLYVDDPLGLLSVICPRRSRGRFCPLEILTLSSGVRTSFSHRWVILFHDETAVSRLA
jgi:hypothetical protein